MRMFGFLGTFFLIAAACGGSMIRLEGRVIKIENSSAVIKETSGDEVRIPMKKISKKNQLMVHEALISKKNVRLDLALETFLK